MLGVYLLENHNKMIERTLPNYTTPQHPGRVPTGNARYEEVEDRHHLRQSDLKVVRREWEEFANGYEVAMEH